MAENSETLKAEFQALAQRALIGNEPEAAKALTRFASQHRDDPFIQTLQAELARERGEYGRAIEFYRRAEQLDPDNDDYRVNVAGCLYAMGEHEKALAEYKSVLQKDPRDVAMLSNCAIVLLELGGAKEAEKLARRALDLSPEYSRAVLVLIKALAKQDRTEEIHALGEKHKGLLCIDIDVFRAWLDAAAGAGVPSVDSDAFIAEVLQKTEDPKQKFNLVLLLQERGQSDLARETLDQLMDGSPPHSGFFRTRVGMEKCQPGGILEKCANELEMALPGFDQQRRTAGHYGLGKYFLDTGETARGFIHYFMGAAIRRSNTPYSPDATRWSHQILRDRAALALSDAATGNSSEQPIIIVGMPRSGTTLTEQILSSHPRVFGAGELKDIPYVLSHYKLSDGKAAFAESDLPPENWLDADGAGKLYLERLYARFGRERMAAYQRITDKMPHNYKYVGFVRKILPNARIIHCQRDPVDTCLSCLTQLFTHGHDWSYDLHELAGFYREYWNMMRYWREKLPGQFYEIRYENTVANLDEEARKLVAYCGLEWDDACLKFHETERSVRTASVNQVRNPIYSSSVRRWEKYEPYLKPLIDDLRDIIDEYYSTN